MREGYREEYARDGDLEAFGGPQFSREERHRQPERHAEAEHCRSGDVVQEEEASKHACTQAQPPEAVKEFLGPLPASHEQLRAHCSLWIIWAGFSNSNNHNNSHWCQVDHTPRIVPRLLHTERNVESS